MIEPHHLKISLVAAVAGLSLVAAVQAYNNAGNAESVSQNTDVIDHQVGGLIALIQKQNQVIKEQMLVIEQQQLEIELAGECK